MEDAPDSRPHRTERILQDYAWNDWGIHHTRHKVEFPLTVDRLVQEVTDAINAVLEGTEKIDPIHASNVAFGGNYHGRKPVRYPHDAGRIGIDVSGAEYLRKGISPEQALRSLGLKLAVALSNVKLPGNETTGRSYSRPVSIYCNTIRQALSASEELLYIRATSQNEEAAQHISVSYIGSGELPQACLKTGQSSKESLSNGHVDPSKGIVLLIQPTDYNSEYMPPGPAIGSVQNIQQIIARAAISAIPVVVLSPRYPGYRDWKASSTLGAASPWILRDFRPPVFTWIYRRKGVSMLQSPTIEGRAWHLFRDGQYYLASTSTTAGKPTKEISKRIDSEFGL